MHIWPLNNSQKQNMFLIWLFSELLNWSVKDASIQSKNDYHIVFRFFHLHVRLQWIIQMRHWKWCSSNSICFFKNVEFVRDILLARYTSLLIKTTIKATTRHVPQLCGSKLIIIIKERNMRENVDSIVYSKLKPLQSCPPELLQV